MNQIDLFADQYNRFSEESKARPVILVVAVTLGILFLPFVSI